MGKGQAVIAIPLFIELTAGLGSVSLRLQGGPHCRPPVSRMGNKAGYAGAILEVLGLRSGQGAEAFLWCEPDDGCRALLQAYPQPEVLREAAEIIRSWADEDPRELWERLRAEGPIRGASGGEVARWVQTQGWRCAGGSWGYGGPGRIPPGDWNGYLGYKTQEGFCRDLEAIAGSERRNRPGSFKRVTPRVAARPRPPAASEIARWARITTSNRLINLDPQTWKNTGQGGTTHGGEDFSTGAEDLARGFEGVSAREVGRHVLQGVWSYRQSEPGSGFVGPGQRRQDTTATATATATARHANNAWPPVTVCADAREVDPGQLPEGTVAYMDPPYQGTTGYGNDLPRAEVVELARRWADAGAVVCISEAEALPALMADGWHSVEITGCRKGQKRTFSKQQREFLTLNRAPAWRPSVTLDLFGGK